MRHSDQAPETPAERSHATRRADLATRSVQVPDMPSLAVPAALAHMGEADAARHLPSAVLRLHGAAGNAAVAQRMQSTVPAGLVPRTVQRVRFTEHARQRGGQADRLVSNTKMREIIRTGQRFSDPNYPDATVYYDPGTTVAVAVVDGNVITTYKTERPKARWVRK